MKKHCFQPLFVIAVFCFLLLPLLTHCSSSEQIQPENPANSGPILLEEMPVPNIEIKFMLKVPEDLKETPVYLDVVDEVTGLTFNPHRYLMKKIDAVKYEISIPFIEGSLVKYRYSCKDSKSVIESSPNGEKVRYRMYYAINPGEVTDTVSAWESDTFLVKTGRIEGTVKDAAGTPLPDIMVTAGGLSTITSVDGSYQLEGVPSGQHNLVAVDLNGNYLPYQQGAVVDEKTITQAPLILTEAKQVKITFVLTQPEGYQDGNPVRLIGNLYETGNIFSNLKGGINISVSKAPEMSRLSDGRYALTLELPAGVDFRYKYTLGDSFWNSELNNKNEFSVRQLIVPETDAIVTDQIEKWQVPNFSPVTFMVSVPEYTPTSDIVSIQFNPNVWTEPIPMWKSGENQWKFTLYNPFHLLSKITYRYCRNSQCDSAVPLEISGTQTNFELDTANLPANITDKVSKWAYLNMIDDTLTVVGSEVKPRGESYIAGIELIKYYEPAFQSLYNDAFQNVKSIGANWTIISPTWHYSSINPPVLEQVPGKDPLIPDIQEMLQEAHNKNLQAAVFPQTITNVDEQQWWKKAGRNSDWWQAWFANYKTFLVHNAIIAQKNGANALILGETGMLPSLPKGKTPDGDSSGVFGDAEARWKVLIDEIRSRFSGELILAVEDPSSISLTGDILKKFDRIYILIDIPLSENGHETQDYSSLVKNYLDEQIYPFQDAIQIPVMIGIKYPSHPNAALGCVQIENRCQSSDVLDQPVSFSLENETDLDIQYKIYEAFLNAVNEREWITGFVSRGYNTPVGLQDYSSSIRGKPSAALLWYWYPRLISPVQ